MKSSQDCGLMVNEEIGSREVSGPNSSSRQKFQVILPICPSLGEQSYLVLLLVGGDKYGTCGIN